jgi:trimeric autotransporter adhesin
VIQGLVINRFAGDGIQLLTKNTAVMGCFIGTTVTGDSAAGNGGNGVSIEGKACDNRIGGTSISQRNVISGNNGYGVMILGATTKGNVLQGNFIGTNAAGTAAVGPGNVNGGVIIGTGSHDNTIGGTAASARNIISGNAQDGVTLFGAGTTGNRVVGNFIGTDVTGMAKLGNKSDGVFITVGANNNIIGGTKAGQGNVISGNTVTGVVMTGNGTSGNQLMGNFIGTDATGLTALGNIDGIHVAMAASGNVIGGAVAGAGNVISGNSGGAVLFADTGTTGNALLGNLIGTDATGAGALGNGYGVVIMTDAAENVVGGTAAGMGNVIAHNGRYGVYITTGSGNSVLGNRFFDNDGLGIDLWFTGVTANDANDTDSGGNSILNFPVLTSAVLDGTNLTISGTINTATNKSLRIEFFASPVADTSGFGEGQTFLGFVDVAMGANNTMNFSQTLAASGVTAGQVITATVTDELGNTSEFSLALTVT